MKKLEKEKMNISYINENGVKYHEEFSYSLNADIERINKRIELDKMNDRVLPRYNYLLSLMESDAPVSIFEINMKLQQF